MSNVDNDEKIINKSEKDKYAGMRIIWVWAYRWIRNKFKKKK